MDSRSTAGLVFKAFFGSIVSANLALASPLQKHANSSELLIRSDESFPKEDRERVRNKWREKQARLKISAPTKLETVSALKKLAIVFLLDIELSSDDLRLSKHSSLLADDVLRLNPTGIDGYILRFKKIPKEMPDQMNSFISQAKATGFTVSIVEDSLKEAKRYVHFQPSFVDVAHSGKVENSSDGDWQIQLSNIRSLVEKFKELSVQASQSVGLYLEPSPTLGFGEFEALQKDDMKLWLMQASSVNWKTVVIPLSRDQTQNTPRGLDWITRNRQTRGLIRADGFPKEALVDLLSLLAQKDNTKNQLRGLTGKK
jgi:hypothetical protein